MTAGRPRRPLTREERALWAEVARSVAPLPGRPPPEPPGGRTPPPPAAVAPEPARPLAATPATPSLPPRPLRLEPRTRRALARGRMRPDATLDLHGLDQAAAHAALVRFLHRARHAGHGLVQVVTGKGGEDADASGMGRGVLRRSVPHWLALPALGSLVLGWEEAPSRRGGAGALYVRLRRARA